MAPAGKDGTSTPAFFPPTPDPSPAKVGPARPQNFPINIGDGFTPEEVLEALKPAPVQEWQPTEEYIEYQIKDLAPGPRPVSFMGRVANIFDIAHTPKTPTSAKGCLKLSIKDDTAAITVRVWYAATVPNLRIGSLVSIWTKHISNGEHGTLSSLSAPLFVSLFPERDRGCYLMVHEKSDNGTQFKLPLGYNEGRTLDGLMTLANFIDGGADVVDAKIMVVVKSIGHRKTVTRKDGTTVENVNLQIKDDSAEATLGFWGTSANTPFGLPHEGDPNTTNPEAILARQPWKAGETILMLQSPGLKIGNRAYLSLSSATIVDIDPHTPDAVWLRKWALRQKSREAVNPPFPEDGTFDINAVTSGPVRCLFTIAELDEFARALPGETFQGYLNVIIMECRLLECSKRRMLFSGDCCNTAVYANALSAKCRCCEKDVPLRLNPSILGQIVDETAMIARGRLLFSDPAWRELLGREPNDLLRLSHEGLKVLSDRLLFNRVFLIFGWTGDESKAGGRICVLGVCS